MYGIVLEDEDAEGWNVVDMDPFTKGGGMGRILRSWGGGWRGIMFPLGGVVVRRRSEWLGVVVVSVWFLGGCGRGG